MSDSGLYGLDSDLSDIEWVPVAMHFLCGSCKQPAQMIGDEIAGETTLDRVVCLTCGTAVDGDDVGEMSTTLIVRYRDQMARQRSRLLIREYGFPEAPVSSVDDELSDPRWPFVLKAEPHDEAIN